MKYVRRLIEFKWFYGSTLDGYPDRITTEYMRTFQPFDPITIVKDGVYRKVFATVALNADTTTI